MTVRPKLNERSFPIPFPEPGMEYITMAEDQWDAVLQTAYDEGWTLLEIGNDEQVVKAYGKNKDRLFFGS